MSAIISVPSVAALQEYYAEICPPSVLVKDAGGGKGKGLFAVSSVEEEGVIYEERPLVWMQHTANRVGCLVCSHCMQYIGSIEHQVARKIVRAALDAAKELQAPAEASSAPGDCSTSCNGRQPSISPEERMRLIREVSGPCGQKVLAMLRGDTRLPYSDQFPLPGVVACRNKCGESFCSAECEERAWGQQHCLLCPGSGGGTPWEASLAQGLQLLGASEADACAGPSSAPGPSPSGGGACAGSSGARCPPSSEAGPSSVAGESEGVHGMRVHRVALRHFYEHADSTNDVFRLTAKVVARTLLAAEHRLQQRKGGQEWTPEQEATEKEAALLHAWKPFSAGWKRPWWEALAVPADVDDERAFRRQLRQLAQDSLKLFRAALGGCRFPQLLDLQVWGSIVGMFELNNLDLQVPPPVEDYFLLIDDLPPAEKGPAQLLTQPLLDALDIDYDAPCEGTGFFALQSCTNHSCCANAAPLVHPDGTLQLVALRALAAGEEVTISYIDVDGEPLASRQAHLADYGFACDCALCREEGAADHPEGSMQ